VGPRPLTADGHARLLRERAALEGSAAQGAEERRRELDAVLERAVPASPDAGADGRAVLGACLEVEGADGNRREIRLVGGDEADASRGWVRVDSPLGAALLGRRAGDSVLVERPRDTLELTILQVRAARGDGT
jgi:transcription elongation factor GreB